MRKFLKARYNPELKAHRRDISLLADAAERMIDRRRAEWKEQGSPAGRFMDMDAVAEGFLSGDMPEDPDRDLIREIGATLSLAGGHQLMVSVNEELSRTKSERIAARVSIVWEGIEGWST